VSNPELKPVLYECGICDAMHSWAFDGDCRDDDNRYFDPEDYAVRNNLLASTSLDYGIEVRSWEDRCYADLGLTSFA
jgi:hypothetical protein